jgi:hypothetical protein
MEKTSEVEFERDRATVDRDTLVGHVRICVPVRVEANERSNHRVV